MIVTYPSNQLREHCASINPDEIALYVELGWQMLRVMEPLGGIGLAAPQVGVFKRMIVYNVHDIPMIMINPVIKKMEGKITDVEGCLSLPGLRCEVDRSAKIEVEYVDDQGETRIRACAGIEAVVVQHEVEHLDGVLLIDHSPKVKKQIQVGALKGHFHKEGRLKIKSLVGQFPNLDTQLAQTIAALTLTQNI